MGDLILPNPRFEKPSLFYPKRKPVGNVKIDTSNKVARNLLFSMMPSSTSRDLVNNVGIKNYGSSYKEYKSSFFADDVDANDYMELDKSLMPDLSNGFVITFFFEAKENDTDVGVNFRTFLDCNGNDGDGVRFFKTSGSGEPWRFRIIANGTGVNLDADTKVYKKGDDIAISLAWDTSTMSIIEDGIVLGSTTQSNTLAAVSHYDWRLGMAIDVPLANESAKTVFKLFTIHSRIGAETLRDFHANPYQFLIPA